MRRYQRTALLVLAISVQCGGQSQSEGKPNVTYWAGSEVDGSTFVLELNSSGKLRFTPATGVISKGTWKRNANTIEMELNGDFVKLTGEIEGDRIDGIAATKRGLKWKWFARQQPYVLSTAAPVYPPLARAAMISGKVLVELEINSLGAVTSISSITGHPLLRTVSEKAARQYRFEPTAATGARTARLSFIFTLVNVLSEKVRSPLILSPYQIEVRGGIPTVERSYVVTN
jgi:TonB family protein